MVSEPFSNHYICEFSDGFPNFNCTEQYMMLFIRQNYFGTRNCRKIFKEAFHPNLHKRLGRKN